MLMLMPSSASAPNIWAAKPGWLWMPSPTIETLATSGHVEVMATGKGMERDTTTTMAVYEELGLL